ncbi:MAG: hypothetical protein HOD92_17335 [Deltaproteobacteria bacterium]|jgi:hypothetical protein|nr:hypothetical protein [Deltaproteobacteria bacterium]MBT4526811.1 hypothetical protein [Deltaproteobacteria bacterium]
MIITWQFDKHDIESVEKLNNRYKDSYFVQQRIKRNLHSKPETLSKELFFKAMVSCLLTTQQRSGPDTPVNNFINTKPFPLNYDICTSQKDLLQFIQQTISNFGGLRRSNSIAREIDKNLQKLENGLWNEIFKTLQQIIKSDSSAFKRSAALYISSEFMGFGPKQSRNLLQSLGYTKYEIPIDSRITKWLNRNGFPLKLTASALSDENYYNFISDGIIELCKACNIEPCILDALIFVSFDKSEWTEENTVW